MMLGSIVKVSVVVASLAMLAGTAARAQQFGGYAPPFIGSTSGQRLQPGDRAPLRVQVNYQLQMPIDRNAGLDDQKNAIETAHAALYDLAKRECDTLVKAFDGECRVVGLSVNNGSQPFGPNAALPFNANATIELVPRLPAPPSNPR